MSSHKVHTGDFTTLFSFHTRKAALAQTSVSENSIVHIRISCLEKHPDNPLDERDIEDLASQIVTNGFHIETIEVTPLENGKYRLISGHRRTAAKRLLLERGEVTDDTMPCIIRKFESLHDSSLTTEDMEILALVAANRGQRHGRNLLERIREAKLLEPIARKIYNDEVSKGNLKKVSFRRFFANGALNESESALQRLKMLEKLTDKARDAVVSGKIAESAAVTLSSLPPLKQDLYVTEMMNHPDDNDFGKINHVKKFVEEEKAADLPKDLADTNNNEPNDNNLAEASPDSDADHGMETDFEPDTVFEPDASDDSGQDGSSGDEASGQRTPKKNDKGSLSKAPMDAVSDAENDAKDWVHKQLEEYHRQNDKVCFLQLVTLCNSEMEKAAGESNAAVRSQWDLRRAAAQFAYDQAVSFDSDS